MQQEKYEIKMENRREGEIEKKERMVKWKTEEVRENGEQKFVHSKNSRF